MMNIAPLPESIRNAIHPAVFVRSLAHGMTLDEALERQRPNAAWVEIAVPDAARAIVLHTIELVNAQDLLPPAAAAFIREQDIDLTALRPLRVRAAQLLTRLVSETADGSGYLIAENEHRGAAFKYAAALLTQEDALRTFQAARVASPLLDGAVDGLDRRRLEDFLLNLSMRGPIKTLDRMVQKWERLATRLEGEHASLVYEEYENELTSRDSLEDALALLSPRARASVEVRIRRADERFAAATGSCATPHKPLSSWTPQRWWWWQVPSRPGELFRAYLEQVVAEERETNAGTISDTESCSRLPGRD